MLIYVCACASRDCSTVLKCIIKRIPLLTIQTPVQTTFRWTQHMQRPRESPFKF